MTASETPPSRKGPKPLAKRKAWRFAPKTAPGFADLLSGGKRRQAFVRYWITDNLWNAAHLATYYSLRLMPMDVVSAAGAALGRIAIPRYHKVAAERARDTMGRIRPLANSVERERLFDAYCEAQGRLMTEFSAVGRVARHPERISVEKLEIFSDAARTGPVILVGLHLGNWELIADVMRSAGVRLNWMYVPPAGRAQAWIAARVRREAGLHLLPPGVAGVRPAVRLLQQGGVVSIFCDEAFGGRIRGPFFGRPPHLEGNIGLAVRLARLTGATICPWYNVRGDGFRFAFRFLPSLTLPQGPASDIELAADAVRLNDRIEPVISAHLEQWFFVDSALPK